MFQRLSKLTPNQRLALLAFVLGARGHRRDADPRRPRDGRPARPGAARGEREADHVHGAGRSPTGSSRGRPTSGVIDLRAEAAFAAVPPSRPPRTSRSPSLRRRRPAAQRADPRSYGDDGVHGGAGVVPARRRRGYTGVYMLRRRPARRGRTRSCTRVLADGADARGATAERQARGGQPHFGGAPRSGGSRRRESRPRAGRRCRAAPAAPVTDAAAGAKPQAPAKKKEGC